MTDESKAVPKTRLGRLGKVAKLAGGVAGGMLAEGARQWRAGNRLKASDLLLTPANARRFTKQLSEMRGAAMKLGQILSMDSGDFLPKELADILAQLRDSAYAMPPAQLHGVLQDAYGDDWQNKLRNFEAKPFAAASIGQVHRLLARDGRDAVLKVQYPGVAESIDSDVDNLAALLRLSGLLPKHIDMKPLLAEVKLQLKDEANYEQEARYLNSFVRALGDDERFLLPRVIPSLTSERILAMTYVPGEPIESLVHAEQAERDRVMSLLIELLLVELFELRLVQTDPNFANYRYNPETGQLVLLDFGASRRFKASFMHAYRDLLAAHVSGDREAVANAANRVGYGLGDGSADCSADGAANHGSDVAYRDLLLDLFDVVLDPITRDAPYDFGASTIPAQTMALSERLRDHKAAWQAPPIDAAYIHRKIGGLFLLASRIKARVNVHALLAPYLP